MVASDVRMVLRLCACVNWRDLGYCFYYYCYWYNCFVHVHLSWMLIFGFAPWDPLWFKSWETWVCFSNWSTVVSSDIITYTFLIGCKHFYRKKNNKTLLRFDLSVIRFIHLTFLFPNCLGVDWNVNRLCCCRSLRTVTSIEPGMYSPLFKSRFVSPLW